MNFLYILKMKWYRGVNPSFDFFRSITTLKTFFWRQSFFCLNNLSVGFCSRFCLHTLVRATFHIISSQNWILCRKNTYTHHTLTFSANNKFLPPAIFHSLWWFFSTLSLFHFFRRSGFFVVVSCVHTYTCTFLNINNTFFLMTNPFVQRC